MVAHVVVVVVLHLGTSHVVGGARWVRRDEGTRGPNEYTTGPGSEITLNLLTRGLEDGEGATLAAREGPLGAGSSADEVEPGGPNGAHVCTCGKVIVVLVAEAHSGYM